MGFDSDSGAEVVEDRSKWTWAIVGGILLLMIIALIVRGPGKPSHSTVRARHILIRVPKGASPVEVSRALERITELKKRAEAGESFAKLAREYSEDEYSAPRGGDLGPQRKHTFEEDFERCVWTVPIGEVSDIVKSSHGFHIVLVESRYFTEVDAYLEKQRSQKPGEAPKAE